MEKQMEKKTAEKEEKKQRKQGKQSLKERVESFPQYKVLLIVLDIIYQSKFFFGTVASL